MLCIVCRNNIFSKERGYYTLTTKEVISIIVFNICIIQGADDKLGQFLDQDIEA